MLARPEGAVLARALMGVKYANFRRDLPKENARGQAGAREMLKMAKSLFGNGANINPAFDVPLRKAYGTTEVRVTPEIAQHWLTFNTSNREVTQAKLEQFHADMERGEWKMQGDTIRFAYGKLLDGQHRLMAVALSGVTLPMLVVHGLDPETQANMDTGRGRTPRDILSIEGLDKWESSTLGSAIHSIMAYESGLALYSARKFLNREVRNYYLEHRAAIEATVQVCKSLPRKHPIVPHARTMALHYIFAKFDRDAADQFFARLMTGEMVAKSSPIFHLRQRLLSDLIDKRKRSAFEQLAFIVKTWNSVRRGGSVKTEAFMRVREGEAFPEIQ